ncbi:MAG: patatin-like phospholipase family protein [Minicystis sp.]
MDHVLYFVADPSRPALEAAREGLERIARRVSALRKEKIHLAFEQSAARALAKLRSGGADALVIDARGEPGGVEESSSLSLLRGLFGEHDLPRVLSRDKAWLVIDGKSSGPALAFEAGRLHIAGVIATHETPEPWEAIWQRIAETTAVGRGGRIALCLAGGGTEGLLYELGVLRALERFLPNYRLQDVDIICGISAGAILGGLLANGIGADELHAGLRGLPSRLDPIRRSDLFDPNLAELGRRAVRLSWEVARGKRSPLSALFRLPPAGLFAGNGLRRWLERQFHKPGMIDRFGDLPHRLYIGATDQDTSEHVVFGAKDAPDVPIHTAIRASTALAPFYAPEQIDGRYYVDGGFTRTTNMRVAVQEGATLVLLVDPLVPVSVNQPGHVADRGAVYTAMQGLKSLINGRFDKVVPTLRAMYPQVAFHIFQPGADTRRVMAGSPMKYFAREAIVEMAYRETIRDIRSSRMGQLARDFQRHGVAFMDPEAPPESGVNAPPRLRVVA